MEKQGIDKNILLNNINLIHSTVLGLERIRKNLKLECDDVVDWCKNKVNDPSSNIIRKGKNWYCENNGNIITINAYNYCIITAHRKK